jgi:hypothetical protein
MAHYSMQRDHGKKSGCRVGMGGPGCQRKTVSLLSCEAVDRALMWCHCFRHPEGFFHAPRETGGEGLLGFQGSAHQARFSGKQITESGRGPGNNDVDSREV